MVTVPCELISTLALVIKSLLWPLLNSFSWEDSGEEQQAASRHRRLQLRSLQPLAVPALLAISYIQAFLIARRILLSLSQTQTIRALTQAAVPAPRTMLTE